MWPRRIEEASLNAWPALQQLLYDGWIVRLANGYTKRANSVTPLYPSALPLGEKVVHCERLYHARGLPAIFRLTSLETPPGLDDLLAERGYRLVDPTLVLYRDLASMRGPTPAGTMRCAGLEEWLRLYTCVSGAPLESDARHAAILTAIVPETYAAYRTAPDGSAAACGLAVQEDDVVGIFDLVTAPTQRRRGHASALVAAMLHWATAAGARHAYLQVVRDNAPARRLYERLRFTERYHYWYRVGR